MVYAVKNLVRISLSNSLVCQAFFKIFGKSLVFSNIDRQQHNCTDFRFFFFFFFVAVSRRRRLFCRMYA